MWLITTLLAAIIVTILWFSAPKKYKLDLLSLMLWGATIMILVDHVLGYTGGEFFVMETEGIITNGFLLGVVMLIPVFVVWGIILLISRRNIQKKQTLK